MGEMIPLAAIVIGGLLLFPVVVGMTLRSLRSGSRQAPPPEDVARLEAELQQTRAELQRLSERQQFVEALLEKRGDQDALPR